MRHHTLWPAILAAASLGACASRPPPVVLPPIALGEHVRDAPRDAACAALVAEARERDARGGFRLTGMLNTRARPGQARPAPGVLLAPVGSHLAGLPARQLDGTFRSLFVQCETRQAYVAQRGGVLDVTYWYGPFAL